MKRLSIVAKEISGQLAPRTAEISDLRGLYALLGEYYEEGDTLEGLEEVMGTKWQDAKALLNAYGEQPFWALMKQLGWEKTYMGGVVPLGRGLGDKSFLLIHGSDEWLVHDSEKSALRHVVERVGDWDEWKLDEVSEDYPETSAYIKSGMVSDAPGLAKFMVKKRGLGPLLAQYDGKEILIRGGLMPLRLYRTN
jgi:hypothetical protein